VGFWVGIKFDETKGVPSRGMQDPEYRNRLR